MEEIHLEVEKLVNNCLTCNDHEEENVDQEPLFPERTRNESMLTIESVIAAIDDKYFEREYNDQLSLFSLDVEEKFSTIIGPIVSRYWAEKDANLQKELYKNLFTFLEDDEIQEEVENYLMKILTERFANVKEIIEKVKILVLESKILSKAQNAKNEKDGKDGSNGNAGESSGNLMVLSKEVKNFQNLKIFLNGADGQDGQEGGDGFNGMSGAQMTRAEFEKLMPKFGRSIGGNTEVFLQNFRNFNWKKVLNLVFHEIDTFDHYEGVDRQTGQKCIFSISLNMLGLVHAYMLVQGASPTKATNGGKGGLGGQGGFRGKCIVKVGNSGEKVQVNVEAFSDKLEGAISEEQLQEFKQEVLKNNFSDEEVMQILFRMSTGEEVKNCSRLGATIQSRKSEELLALIESSTSDPEIIKNIGKLQILMQYTALRLERNQILWEIFEKLKIQEDTSNLNLDLTNWLVYPEKWIPELKKDYIQQVVDKTKFYSFLLQIVDEVINLKRGYRLRDSHKIAILSALTSNTKLLMQVATGEGKSLIIAVIAIIKAIEGETVDVITSSHVLAKRDADFNKDNQEGMGDLYAYFGVKVGHNCDEDSEIRRKAYQSCLVVYGDLGNFQRDFLLDTYYNKNILEPKSGAQPTAP
uniref:Chloroplast protein-transporting ATPase n=1 Tax=Acrobeloides nanus TaxID=290746 RepID=A0A914DIL7_9BILA